MVVDDPRALRRLDRIDAVVVDAAVLATGRWAIDEVSPLEGEPDAPDLHARALGLVDPEDPTATRERDGWRTEPAGSARRLYLYQGARRAAVVSLLIPALVFAIPIHVAVLGLVLLVMTVMGVTNHMGWEMFPRALVHSRAGNWLITASHHHRHHEQYRCNYGLYFRFWDRLCGTDKGLSAP